MRKIRLICLVLGAGILLAAVLAVIFYLVRLRRYENDDTSHPAGERPAPRMQEIRKDA